MNKNRYLKSIDLLQAIIGIILALMSFVFLPVCPPLLNGMHMSCYYTGVLLTVAGIVLFILAVSNYFIKHSAVNKIIVGMQGVVAVLSYLIPSKIIPIAVGTNMHGQTKLIGLCTKPMRCWNSFRVSSICLLIVVILVLLYLAIQYVTKKTK